jgi:hypothetical protein
LTSRCGAEERHKVVAFADDGLTLDYRPKRPGAVKGMTR